MAEHDFREPQEAKKGRDQKPKPSKIGVAMDAYGKGKEYVSKEATKRTRTTMAGFIGILLLVFTVTLVLGVGKVKEYSQSSAQNKGGHFLNRIGGAYRAQVDNTIEPGLNIEQISTAKGMFEVPYFTYVVWVVDKQGATYWNFKESMAKLANEGVSVVVIDIKDYENTKDKGVTGLPEGSNAVFIFENGGKNKEASMSGYIYDVEKLAEVESKMLNLEKDKKLDGRN